MDKITRAKAKQQGLKWFYTGRPCKYRHLSERSTTTGICRTCQKLKNAGVNTRSLQFDDKGLASVMCIYAGAPKGQAMLVKGRAQSGSL